MKPETEGITLLPAPVKAGLTPVEVMLPPPGNELDGLAPAGLVADEGIRPPVEKMFVRTGPTAVVVPVTEVPGPGTARTDRKSVV